MNEPLRICHVLTSMEIGGMESVVCTLMQAQAESGEVTSLFCTDVEGAFFEGAVASARMCAGRKRALLLVDWSVVRKLIRFAREQKIDILHAHNPVGQLYAVLASRRLKIPVVVTYHGQAFQETTRRRLLRTLLCRSTEAVVAISEDVKTLLVSQHVAPEEKTSVVKNGIYVGETINHGIEFEQKETKGTKDTVTIGSVGRLSPEKNYPMLIRAFMHCRSLISDLRPPVSNLRLLFIGDGSERASLEALSEELGLTESVKFMGASDDVSRWLGVMDIFCLSSLSEGTSIALLEAAAHGLPAVVTDVGGNGEIVQDGVTGVVTPSGDLEAFVSALVRMCSDPELRKQMGMKARQHVLDVYSASVMAEAYSSIYARVLNRR
jgi:glycosyltransferase involved in cell wall biosynthesis